MSTILNILLAILLIVVVVLLICILPYILHFYNHLCKHCGHSMEYKGLKEDDREGHYLFHCPKCGAWEQIPKEVFLRSFFDKVDNPLEQ